MKHQEKVQLLADREEFLLFQAILTVKCYQTSSLSRKRPGFAFLGAQRKRLLSKVYHELRTN